VILSVVVNNIFVIQLFCRTMPSVWCTCHTHDAVKLAFIPLFQVKGYHFTDRNVVTFLFNICGDNWN
jgi:hypothetical protein